MYLTYDEYVQRGGTMNEADFNIAEFKAESYIDYLTDSRVQNMAEVPEAVKMAIMSIMQVEGSYGVGVIASSPVVASFSTDGYSESYGSAEEQAGAAQKALKAEINRMLYGVKDDDGVPLLYRGLT